MPKQLLIAGAGFLGSEICRQAAADGWHGILLSRTANPPAPTPSSFQHLIADMAKALPLHADFGHGTPDAIILCISSPRGAGAEGYRESYLAAAQSIANAVDPLKTRVVFSSSTSVYGQTDGDWVDESSPTRPPAETGNVLLETEKTILSIKGTVLRLAGLYGPGRSVYLRNFRQGNAIIEGDGSRFINQIHRDDAARAALHVATLPEAASEIYNVCDNSPMTQRALYESLARHFQSPSPPRGPVNLQRKRGWSNKRVSNAKLRKTSWSPRFPDFLSALATCRT